MNTMNGGRIMEHLYLYFSGTGNTKFVVERFATALHPDATIRSIEHDDIHYDKLLQTHRNITFAHPIYESMMPPIMSEFIDRHRQAIHHKTISVIVTQMLFSGDGAALVARRLKKQNNTIRHTIHINMPNNLTDLRIFPSKSAENCQEKIDKAKHRINRIIKKIRAGKHINMGRRPYSWLLGFFTQRLYALPFYGKMRKKIKINANTCIGCGQCVDICPMDNLSMDGKKVIAHDRCTLCYRCINACPVQAMSLFSKHGPSTQYIRDSYN